MDKKQHFEELLSSLKGLSLNFKNYRDRPEEIIAYWGTELKDYELPDIPMTAYDLLLKRITSIQRESKLTTN